MPGFNFVNSTRISTSHLNPNIYESEGCFGRESLGVYMVRCVFFIGPAKFRLVDGKESLGIPRGRVTLIMQ